MYGHSVVFICLMWARWAESEAPPPFIRPEPIIMTSPQGSIHFNYHPLSSVCVRKPGKKHFYMLGKVTDRSWDLSGSGDISVTHCENWDMFIFRRDLVEQVVLVKLRRSAQHLLNLLWGDWMCVCAYVRAHCICLSVSLNMIEIPAASDTKGLHTEKSPPSLNALCL